MKLEEIEDGGIDAGLVTLEALFPDGAELSLREIAKVCGCRMQNIWYIEQRALKKLRKEFEERGLTGKNLL